MASQTAKQGVLQKWYTNRIAEPTTDDEVRGYWVFVFGLLVGVLAILLFVVSTRASMIRQSAIALGAVALLLLVVGPIIRLPLRRRATLVSYLGQLIGLVAIVWFILEYPQWRAASAQIISLYAVGLAVVGAGGILVPLLSTHTGEAARERAKRESEMQSELDEQTARVDELEADVEARDATIDELEADRADLEAELDDREETVEELMAALAAHEESQATFELYEDSAGDHRWRLRHRNGNVIADGGQGYASRQKAQQGLQSVKRNAYGAAVVRAPSTASDEEEAAHPEPTVAPYPDGESQATFELFEDNAGEYRWRLRHDNGNIIADSGEGYSSKHEARRAVERVAGYVGPAQYLRPDPTAFDVYRDAAEEWRWRLVHQNGNVLADSGQGYSSRTAARNAVDRIREGVADAPTDADSGFRFELYEDAADEYRWRLVSSNDKIMADSGEGYTDRSELEAAVERVRSYAPEADAVDVGRAVVEVYEDTAGEWRWRLRHRNGNIIADSGEGYAERNKAYDAVDGVKRNAPNADVVEESNGTGDGQ